MYEVRNLYLEHISKDRLIGSLNLAVEMGIINYYYGILHDKDINENGETKKAHFHLYLESEDTREMKKYLVSHIYDKVSFVRIQAPKNALLYLIHKKDLNKHQYEVKDVFSNNIDYVIDAIASYKPKPIKETNKTSNEELVTYIESKALEFKTKGDEVFEGDLIQWCRDLNKRDYYIKNKNRLIQYMQDIGYHIYSGAHREKLEEEKIQEEPEKPLSFEEWLKLCDVEGID